MTNQPPKSDLYPSKKYSCQSKNSMVQKSLCCTFPDCGKLFRKKSDFKKHSLTHLTENYQKVSQVNFGFGDLLQIQSDEIIQEIKLVKFEKNSKKFEHSSKNTNFSAAQLIFGDECSPKSLSFMKNSIYGEDSYEFKQMMKVAIVENQNLKKKLLISQRQIILFQQQTNFLKEFIASKKLSNSI